ncbi:MAG: AraC family transcriptional regulator ligand-binding domain-containing protein [Rhodocyclaceae bacterium]|nr:AraC family transcriptional regulator ligand-binding domain-containing protein [Rhodocyclaceae bacterium]
MPLYEATIPARYALPLLDIVGEQDPACVVAMLDNAGLDHDGCRKANAVLQMSQYDTLLVTAAEWLGRGDFGFEVGRRITIDDHSALTLVLHGCQTLHELFRVVERYHNLVTPSFAVRYLPGPEQCEWRLRVAAPMSQLTMRMFLELHAVSFHVDLVRLLGPRARSEIFLSIPPPKHVKRYRQLTPTRFHFSAGALPEVRLVLPSALVMQPLRPVAGDVDGAALLAAAAMPQQLAQEYGGWIDLMLREAEAVQPTLADFADMLAMSPRNLTRKLTAEGVNLREMANRIRHERACAMLANPRMALPQIAYRLGYSGTTTFIRCFRSVSGTTPAVWRQNCTQ